MGAPLADTKDSDSRTKGWLCVPFVDYVSGHLNQDFMRQMCSHWSLAADLSPIDVDLTRFGNTTTTENIIITAKLKETGGWSFERIEEVIHQILYYLYQAVVVDKEHNPNYLFILTIFVRKLLKQKFQLLLLNDHGVDFHRYLI